jgi:hypothetical protein
VRLPEAGGEQMDLEGRMGINPLEHVHEIDLGIDTLQPTRGEQTLNDTDVVRAHFRPAEHPVSDRQSLRKGKVYEPVIDGNLLRCPEGSTPSRERFTTTRKRVLQA